jgi:collagenase-like PrtC family protease
VCENGRFSVEANDMGAVNMLADRARFVAGPHLNVYNASTLELLHAAGARRWVMPVELGREVLARLQAARPAGLETEVFAFGRLPLAFSARCFTARAHNLAKDDCGLRCADYPDGLLLSTQEAKPFLTLNGIQTQSAETCNLAGELAELQALGVDVLRISPMGSKPQPVHPCTVALDSVPESRRGPRAEKEAPLPSVARPAVRAGASADSPPSRSAFEVVEIFRAALAGALDAPATLQRLAPYMPYGACNGYWHSQAGMAWSG